MPLDPEVAALLEKMRQEGAPPAYRLTPQEAREARIAAQKKLNAAPRPVGRVLDQTIPGPEGSIPVRIYTPSAQGPFPLLVFFHGGGWVVGNLDTVDDSCRALAELARCVVVSVDYRLAPEHKFPAPFDDAFAATTWCVQHATELGADPEFIAVGGDSAGGNLAAAVAIKAKGTLNLAYQMLIYPITNYAFDTDSYQDNAEGYFLTREGMMWYWQQYLDSPTDGAHVLASPLRASDLTGLPQALVLTAEFDPLRDEGEQYAKRLQDSGVPVTSIRVDGLIHGFFTNQWGLSRREVVLAQVSEHLHQAYEEHLKNTR
ncbi:alpha/beta hydrolase [Alicyclobacillus tolerans]|uniref:alpha/beta hydrolase n=1 Tax=Alicyclobacillus tolerans TaxID=90970 RepID=UPI001F3DA51D|nr:alpha/beta hydrolase [Alicyclobacillus tolerans]MCF8565851.1 alpha/beta hydrolase [Alicyclobacillus tolerans]